METKRIEWLDIAKGIGIILVVWGHCLNISTAPFHLIFTFHMPMFFFLSGFVSSDRHSFLKTAGKKAKSLLLPFAEYFLLGLAVTLLLPQWREKLTANGIFQDLWLSAPNNVHNSSIWFLVCLFLTALLFRAVQRLPLCVLLPILAGLFAFGVWYPAHAIPVMGYARLPFTLDVVPVALIFYAIGYYAKKEQAVEWVCKSRRRELCTAVIGAAGVAVVYWCNGYVNLHGQNFGNPALFLAGGLLGTAAVIGVSALCARMTGFLSPVRRVLGWYGRHSLVILGLQSLLIRLYIEFCNTFLGKSLALYQFPLKHALFSGVLVAFVLCPALCLLADGGKAILNKLRKRTV